MSRPLYLDYNATTPIDPAVAEAMLPFLYEHFGNPSSSHAYGAVARGAVEKAGGNLIVPPEGFYVEDTEGPMKPGEIERAAAWATNLLGSN